MGGSDGWECTEGWLILSIVSARELRGVCFPACDESWMESWKRWKLPPLGRAVRLARAGKFDLAPLALVSQ